MLRTDGSDGGPAFPRPDTAYSKSQTGMSLRDWFAGQALSVFLNSPHTATVAREKGMTATAVAAVASYEAADAMLEARK